MGTSRCATGACAPTLRAPGTGARTAEAWPSCPPRGPLHPSVGWPSSHGSRRGSGGSTSLPPAPAVSLPTRPPSSTRAASTATSGATPGRPAEPAGSSSPAARPTRLGAERHDRRSALLRGLMRGGNLDRAPTAVANRVAAGPDPLSHHCLRSLAGAARTGRCQRQLLLRRPGRPRATARCDKGSSGLPQLVAVVLTQLALVGRAVDAERCGFRCFDVLLVLQVAGQNKAALRDIRDVSLAAILKPLSRLPSRRRRQPGHPQLAAVAPLTRGTEASAGPYYEPRPRNRPTLSARFKTLITRGRESLHFLRFPPGFCTGWRLLVMGASFLKRVD